MSASHRSIYVPVIFDLNVAGANDIRHFQLEVREAKDFQRHSASHPPQTNSRWADFHLRYLFEKICQQTHPSMAALSIYQPPWISDPISSLLTHNALVPREHFISSDATAYFIELFLTYFTLFYLSEF